MGLYSIVDSRADNSLFLVSNDFQDFSSVISRSYNKVELNCSKTGLNELYTTYKIINKWMGRVYIFKIYGTINHPYTEDIWVSLKYKGNFKSSTPVFFSRKSNPLLEILNMDKEIINICKAIDLEKLEIKFDCQNNKWSIEIWPNFGDYIWMLIPPLRYMRRPSQIEVQQTYELMKRLSKMINKL